MEDKNKATSSLIRVDAIDNSVESMLAFGEKLVKSGLTPMKKAEDVMAAILMGKELGFAPMVSVNNIYSIQGRASVGIHIITGLLLKAGIIYDFIEDYVPLYRYKDKSGKLYTTDNLHEANREDIVSKEEKPYDVRTKIKFRRKVKQPDGTYEPLEITQSFTWTDAIAAGLTDKDNWKRMPKIMLRTRCLTLGARLIAPDLMLGVSEHTEFAEIHKLKVNVNQDTSEVVIDTVAVDVTENDNEPEISSKVSDTNKDNNKTEAKK